MITVCLVKMDGKPENGSAPDCAQLLENEVKIDGIRFRNKNGHIWITYPDGSQINIFKGKTYRSATIFQDDDRKWDLGVMQYAHPNNKVIYRTRKR